MVETRPQPETLAERYARLAMEGGRRRRVDVALRALDMGIAGAALIVLAPIAAPIALLVLLTSGRPVLYGGERVGRYGVVFRMRKFRTLRPDAESRLGPYYGAELDARTPAEVTRLGRWLRSSQLDEVPQLWNVLNGDMSIVGPRPIRPRFFEELCEEIPMYWQRLVVRPGLTGFAQTRMGREPSWAEKLAHDLEWIADRSVGLYLRIVTATAWRVVRQSVAAFVRRPPPTGQRAFSPTTYDREIRVDVADYDELQQQVVAATAGIEVDRVLDLGTGTGETARRVLEAHSSARLVALDASPGMLAIARGKLPAARVEAWREQDLADELPGGPYDLVVSALAVHHLDAHGKRALFRRIAAELRAGGRFVLADVVVPDEPEDAVVPLTRGYDLPERTADLLAWLVDAGFEVQVGWARRDLAVIAARRL
jgi:tRNA (cmo5U34)-methyltransferase